MTNSELALMRIDRQQYAFLFKSVQNVGRWFNVALWVIFYVGGVGTFILWKGVPMPIGIVSLVLFVWVYSLWLKTMRYHKGLFAGNPAWGSRMLAKRGDGVSCEQPHARS